MDLFSSDNNDLDYYVEYESGDEARNWRQDTSFIFHTLQNI